MTARIVGVLVAAPFAVSGLLLGFGRAGRALRNLTRRSST